VNHLGVIIGFSGLPQTRSACCIDIGNGCKPVNADQRAKDVLSDQPKEQDEAAPE
jgi:hypothetical protein